ncbi:MAG: HAD hydrolase-like protein [Gammaproteobacteria bacterium]|nr:HAD hydrolase-like protein [Gammaproteobacteria bacterium]
MLQKHIIFDFDGTIADSLLALSDITQQLAPLYRFQPITPDMLPEIRQMPAQHILTYLKIKPWLTPILMMAVRQRLRAQIPYMKLQPGLRPLFKALPEYTLSIGILSSNSKKNIQRFLSQHQLKQFDYIHVEKYRLSKLRALHHLFKAKHLIASNTCYVVDEVRDIEAAQSIGITSIAVTWGYNDKTALARAKPDFIVDTPHELETVLMQFNQS